MERTCHWPGVEPSRTPNTRDVNDAATPADNTPMLTTFTNRWPWKTQEKLTIALLPALAAIPAFTSLTLSHLPVTPFQAGLLGVGVLSSALLWRTGHTRKVRSEIRATLEGDTLTVSSRRHGETSGDLSGVTEVRIYRHTVTLENVLSVRTVTGELRVPVRLLVANPDLAAIVADRSGHRDAVVNAVSAGAL
jgi:hypothetical protein